MFDYQVIIVTLCQIGMNVPRPETKWPKLWPMETELMEQQQQMKVIVCVCCILAILANDGAQNIDALSRLSWCT